MKTISRIFIAILLMVTSYVSNAQGINFQGVARSANGTILASSNISLRLSIISKSVDATPEYIETKKVVTNAQGIFSIVIGDAVAGSTTGSFKTLNWADAPKFLKVEMDPSGGTSYINMGITQLQYVPFSFYSLGVAAENVTGVLPVEKGGTGVGSLAGLRTALNITNFDSTALSSRIDTKLTKTDTTSLSNRIDGKMSSSNAVFSTDINVNGNIIGLGTGSVPSNIVIGNNSLKKNTLGYSNTVVGSNSFIENTTGFRNSVFGDSSMMASTTGNQNTAIGSYSLASNRTGSNNSALGFGALRLNTTGSNNNTLGYYTLYNNSIGTDNVAIGEFALQENDEGSHNIAIGSYALQKNKVSVAGSLGGQGFQNVAIGSWSLQNATSNSNVAVGSQVLQNLTIGGANTGLGEHAMRSLVTGGSNVSIGYMSMIDVGIDVSNAIMIGRSAGQGLKTGSNVGVGNYALAGTTTGSSNVAIGNATLERNTTGSRNSALGQSVMPYNTSGENNTSIGSGSMALNTIGSNNTALGTYSLDENSTGSNNTSIGKHALQTNTTASNNTSLGFESMFLSINGDNNTTVGASSLYNNTSGSGNSAFGHNAGLANTIGNNNLYIGKGADASVNNLSNAIAIGATASVTTSNTIQLGNTSITDVKTSGVISSSGIRVGTNSPTTSASVEINSTTQGLLPPRMTQSQRDAISSPATGLVIFNTTSNNLEYKSSSSWVSLTASISSSNGIIIYIKPSNEIWKSNIDGTNQSKINIINLPLNYEIVSDQILISANGQEIYFLLYTPTTNQSLYKCNIDGTGLTKIIDNVDELNNLSLTTSAIVGVPYTGATEAVDLGAYNMKVNGITVGVGSSTYTQSANTNTVVGKTALSLNTTGLYNVANGYESLNANTTGMWNTSIGSQSLYTNTIGQYNTAVGGNALASDVSGNENTAIGFQALVGNFTGSGNTGIGRSSMRSNSIGSNNTAVGFQADVASNNLSNATAIGNGAVVSASNTIQLGNSSVAGIRTSGALTTGAVTYPILDGTANQVLLTNGSGVVSFGTIPTLNQNTTGNAATATTAGNITATTNTTISSLSNLVTVGTITSGTWSATTIALAKGGTGATTKTAGFDALSPMTTSGDIIYGGTSGSGTRLGKGSNGQILTLASGLPTWANATGGGGGVPYTGATEATDLGAYDMKVNGLTIGTGAGTTTVTSSTAIGKDALKANTLGTFNTGIGMDALKANTEGTANTALGSNAMLSNTTTSFNTAIGFNSQTYATSSGGYNTSVGATSLVYGGSENTAFGSYTLSSNTGGENNAVGTYALQSNTTGSGNNSLGSRALKSNTTGLYNLAIGSYSLYSNVGNSRSVAIGHSAMYFADDRSTGRTTGNTAVGYESLKGGSTTPSNNTGQNNTALGYQTLTSNTSGSNNTAIGYSSMSSSSTYSNSTALGYNAQVTASNQIQLGDANITDVKTSGTLTLGSITYPNTAGTNGQVLTSTNAGTLTWTTLSLTPVFLPTVVIGTQQWMRENLDVMTYRNGDVIPQVTDNTVWAGLTTGAWCWYSNSADNGTIYGKLYNWYAVNDARGLAPQGWHIPTDAEWTTLGNLLGGDAVAGGKMKTTGTTRWNTPNTSATNESGFAGLPGGNRNSDGTYVNISGDGSWWSATPSSSTVARFRQANYNSVLLNSGNAIMVQGYSVRCLRD